MAKKQSSPERGEVRFFTTDWAQTPNFDNITSGGACKLSLDGKWCYGPTNLELIAPNAKWVFDGNLTIETQEPFGPNTSASWNRLDIGTDKLIKEGRLIVNKNNPTDIDVTVITGSGPVHVRLCCSAEFYPLKEI